MAACRRVLKPYLARNQLFYGYCFPKLYSTELAESRADQGETEIVVPLRIKRGPTDILKALATTISRDYTAAHYKYHDDPYFIPLSNISKRSFALSKESGKRAARYFLENYPEYFVSSAWHSSVPYIPAFDPPIRYTEENDLDEETLQDCVKSHDLPNSITVYQILKQKDIHISQETKQMLLELLCFYNETPPISEDYSEERWFSLTNRKQRKTWKSKGLAEQLFKDCNKDSAAYCAMIQGTAKYFDVAKAFELYEEMRSENLPASLQVYNGLLPLVPLMREHDDSQWEYAMELVSNMNREGFFPNLYTMNALLGIVSRNDRWNKGKSIAMQILSEMKRLAIEPSLGSYYHILKIFFQGNSSYPSVFADILEKIEGQDLKIQHPHDLMFFVTAMEICHKYLSNVDLGYRLHAVLEKGQNSSLIGSAYNESVYYQNLFKLLCLNEDFEKFMEFYQKYAPNVYTPEPSVMHEIVLAAELSGAYQHLPQIGSDLIMFEHSDREHLTRDFLRVSASVKHEEQVQKPLVETSFKLMELVDDRQPKMMRRSFQWTGATLGDMLKIFLNGEDLEKAKHVVLKLRKDEASIIGYPEGEVLVQFCSTCLENKDFDAVKMCVQYAVDSFYPGIRSDLSQVVEDMFKSGKLSEADRLEVNTFIERIQEHDEEGMSGEEEEEESSVPDNEKENSSS